MAACRSHGSGPRCVQTIRRRSPRGSQPKRRRPSLALMGSLTHSCVRGRSRRGVQRATGASLWDHFGAHPAEGAQFGRAMRELTAIELAALVRGCTWPSSGVICDGGVEGRGVHHADRSRTTPDGPPATARPAAQDSRSPSSATSPPTSLHRLPSRPLRSSPPDHHTATVVAKFHGGRDILSACRPQTLAQAASLTSSAAATVAGTSMTHVCPACVHVTVVRPARVTTR
jgi:hypothetical protein